MLLTELRDQVSLHFESFSDWRWRRIKALAKIPSYARFVDSETHSKVWAIVCLQTIDKISRINEMHIKLAITRLKQGKYQIYQPVDKPVNILLTEELTGLELLQVIKNQTGVTLQDTQLTRIFKRWGLLPFSRKEMYSQDIVNKLIQHYGEKTA